MKTTSQPKGRFSVNRDNLVHKFIPKKKAIHEDHIAAKGDKSLNHCILAHRFIPMKKAMRSPDAKAAVENNEKTRNDPRLEAWIRLRAKRGHSGSTKIQKQSPLCVIDGEMSSQKTAELKPKFQKYKGKVVVFTIRGSSASQMTAAKVMDVMARLPDSGGQAADAIPACTLR